MKQLPSGELISYDDIFSPFEIYVVASHPNSYLLIPKQNQEELDGVVIVANSVGIRICRRGGWPKSVVPNIHTIIACKSNNKLSLVGYQSIPLQCQDVICDRLVKQIKYQSK